MRVRIYSLSANPETSITDVTPGLTPSRVSRDSDITSPRSILPSLSTHPILSITAIILDSTASVVSCGSDVMSPSTVSVRTYTSSCFSHSSDAISQIAVRK